MANRMDTKFIIQQGERAKYIVTSKRADFDFENNDYTLEIHFGMMGQKITIPKSQFKHEGGYWVVSFPTDAITGKIMARLVMQIGTRQEVDDQYIGFVISNPCPQFFKCPKCVPQEHDIEYTRIEASNIGEQYAILCDCNGVALCTADDEYLMVLRSILNS